MNLYRILQEHPVLTVVQAVADELNLATYVVGGFVRDALLNKASKDLDIACVGDGPGLARAVADKLNQMGEEVEVAIYKNFGTALVRWKGFAIEFVGTRKESYRAHSRNPKVTPGSLADDQRRRDFTVNALACSLNTTTFGELIDPFQGQQHLRERRLVTPVDPVLTFADDPLRILRAVRFSAQLDFSIDATTWAGLVQTVDRLRILSQERITEEINKILQTPVPSKGFYLLDKAQALSIVFPELLPLKGRETIQGLSHKDNFDHTLRVLDNVAAMSNNLWLRWAALLHDIAKPATKRFDPVAGFTFHGHEELGARMVPRIFQRLRLPSNGKMRYVQKLVRLHLRPIALAKEGVTDTAIRRLIYEAGDDLTDLMRLCRGDITSGNPRKVKTFLRNFDRVEQLVCEVENKDRIRNFQPILAGEDIMQIFGISPSKAVGVLKNALKDAILDGIIPNEYDAAYNYLCTQAAELGLHPQQKAEK